MADEKWQKVREIFDSALRQKPDQRRTFVHQVCGDDRTLLAEVESLLSSIDSASSSMETPAAAKVANMIEVGHFHHAAYNIACAYAVLNKPDEAVRYLQMAAENGYPCYPLFASDPNLNAIRQEPKFQSFLSEQKRQWEYYKSLPQL